MITPSGIVAVTLRQHEDSFTEALLHCDGSIRSTILFRTQRTFVPSKRHRLHIRFTFCNQPVLSIENSIPSSTGLLRLIGKKEMFRAPSCSPETKFSNPNSTALLVNQLCTPFNHFHQPAPTSPWLQNRPCLSYQVSPPLEL